MDYECFIDVYSRFGPMSLNSVANMMKTRVRHFLINPLAAAEQMDQYDYSLALDSASFLVRKRNPMIFPWPKSIKIP